MRTCLVLGAGATLANAAHFRPIRLQSTHPPLDATFFQTVESRHIRLSRPLRKYFEDVVGIVPTPARLRDLRMEEVFKDVFHDFQDAPSNTATLNAYVDLVDLYLRVLRETTNWLGEDNRHGGPVGRLIAAAANVSDDLTVLTFNHDLLIENEIARRANLRSRWCLDEGYGTFGARLTPLYPTVTEPTFTMHHDGLCDHRRPIRVLKLHGSLNWVVRIQSIRPTVRVLSGQPANREVHLLTKRAISDRESVVRVGRGRTQWNLWPVVVPPVYAKQALRATIQDVWHDARNALEAADRIVFFGYSLPLIDVEAEKLFERALAKRTGTTSWLDVVNPAPISAGRYAALAPRLPARWYPSLREFFAAGGLA